MDIIQCDAAIDTGWVFWSDLIIEQVMMRSIKSRGGLTRGRGFTESTRHQWVHTAVIHEAMTSTTKSTLGNSEQHVELELPGEIVMFLI